MLQAIKCQTSPDYPLLRYGDPNKYIAIDFGADGGFLYQLSSNLLFFEDDQTSCAARSMSLSAIGDDKNDLRGSLSLLYWFFITLCTSQLFETFACALQGKQPMPETGMTIFEHSLAFAECEAMLSSALGFGFFGLPKIDGSPSSSDSTASTITRAEILPRLNVPPEVLLVCLISCFSHLSSAILAVTKIRHKVRLVNTAIWAFCYMAAFFWSFTKIFLTPGDHIADLGVLRFPTVCIVGFIPHLLILAGILVCAIIYALAVFITALSVPTELAQQMSFRQRLAWAYDNLQANVQFSTNSAIRIRMSEDFYTTLLKVGFNVLTAASEAVYLNEGSRIQVAKMTWLEQKRIDEMAESIDQRKQPLVPSELLGEGIARGVDFVDHQNSATSKSPYARERKSRPTSGEGTKHNSPEMDTGLGIAQRRSRMQLTFDFITGIFWLAIRLQAQILLNTLNSLRVEHQPVWLLRAAGIPSNQMKPASQQTHDRSDLSRLYATAWHSGQNLPLGLTADSQVDVEVEIRNQQLRDGVHEDEEALSDRLYDWWRQGGWFGEVDSSGDFQPRDDGDDDDTTSVVSVATSVAPWEDEWADEDSYGGETTPTRRQPFSSCSREDTPVPDSGLDLSSLARLLNPRTLADRDEARRLSHSIQSNVPLTRSQYRRTVDRSRSKILGGLRASANQNSRAATEEEEEADLESFLLAQRRAARAKSRNATGGTWESGAEGMGEGGPQCVVCQSAPRTVLVWPCGCLSMCDDCRVGLAARNYTKCICCRTDIAAYSRLYVP